MTQRVADYALIGDLRTAALVDPGGAIAWWCVPRFDSGALFAQLLGGEEAGFWRLAPRDPLAVRRAYRGDSLVLETIFETRGGAVRLSDALALETSAPTLVRMVEGIRGSVEMEMRLRPRMHYGQVAPWTRRRGDAWLAFAAPDGLALRADVTVAGDGADAVAAFAIGGGERAGFVLRWFPAHGEPPQDDAGAAALLESTAAAWEGWAAGIRYRGPRRDAVVRSALVLKALTDRETGALVAAPTTSLPERLGGSWNWDYRYCWIRDASYAARALLRVGCAAEALALCDWLLRVYAGRPEEWEIMYGVAGERLTAEVTLPWLAGFRGSRPVRVGNDAHGQFQLGVLGEATRAFVAASDAGWRVDAERWTLLEPLIGYLETVWDRPGNGIWETRGVRHRYVHSLVMAWRAAEDLALLAPAERPEARERARALAARIRADVERRGFHRERRAFVAHYGSRALDASALLIPVYGFLPAGDPRVSATIAAIESELTVDGYVFRYSRDIDTPQGSLDQREGAFTTCGFWLVLAYVAQRRLADAEALFARLAATANDVGILSEEYDVGAREAVGNTPQAYSHAGLIDAALALDAALDAGGGSPGREAADRAPARSAGEAAGR